MNTFSDLNFSPLQHEPLARNIKTPSTYFMIVPISMTSDVNSKLLLKPPVLYHLFMKAAGMVIRRSWKAAFILEPMLSSITFSRSLACIHFLFPKSDFPTRPVYQYFTVYHCICHCPFSTTFHPFILFYSYLGTFQFITIAITFTLHILNFNHSFVILITV